MPLLRAASNRIELSRTEKRTTEKRWSEAPRARCHGIQIRGRTVNLPSAPAFSAARLHTR